MEHGAVVEILNSAIESIELKVCRVDSDQSEEIHTITMTEMIDFKEKGFFIISYTTINFPSLYFFVCKVRGADQLISNLFHRTSWSNTLQRAQ